MDLKGKTALVTGGASGLGEATVRRYHDHGANVAILDMNDERGEALAKELGDRVRYFNGNVTSEDRVAEIIADTVEAFGGIHICNNFAGIGSAHKTYDKKKDAPHPLDTFKTVLDVNLVGTFNVARLAAQQMASQDPVTEDGQRGVIINTASVAGYEGQIGQVAYSASKGGVIGMTIVIARDLAQVGVRCNTIVPGLIHTPLFDTLPDHIFQALENTVLYPNRLGKPDEIAMLSQQIVENDYINGECIRMDGGIRMTPR
ncbi:MAG: SDR family NAD(P)-dependent oxidoreductase [Pseudomonadota bacterium]